MSFDASQNSLGFSDAWEKRASESMDDHFAKLFPQRQCHDDNTELEPVVWPQVASNNLGDPALLFTHNGLSETTSSASTGVDVSEIDGISKTTSPAPVIDALPEPTSMPLDPFQYLNDDDTSGTDELLDDAIASGPVAVHSLCRDACFVPSITA